MKKHESAAFPMTDVNCYDEEGLTKREYMATAIFAAMVGDPARKAPTDTMVFKAKIAVASADLLIAELRRGPQP